MIKPIAIVAGEPNSISSEIIFKSWKLRNRYAHKPFIVIGSIHLLNLQKKKLRSNIKIREIRKNLSSYDLDSNELFVYNVDYKQKKPFQKISKKSNKYIYNCFNLALNLIERKKIIGIINCPIAKEFLFKNKYQGITEFLAKKSKVKGYEVMLIFNKKLSVSPLTTHIPINYVSRNISKSKIIKKTKIINNFYINFLKRKPSIGILGLNPHNFSQSNKSEEKEIISPAVKAIRKLKIKAIGPLSPDTSFILYKKYKLDVILGMYHDQVLSPFKSLSSQLLGVF